jgi:hypothetical protein
MTKFEEKKFKKELLDVLNKYDVKLTLSCWDLYASLSYDDKDSTDNEICSCLEDRFDCVVINKFLEN